MNLLHRLLKPACVLTLALMLSAPPHTGQAAEKKAKKAAAPAAKEAKGIKDATTGMQFVWVPGGCYMMGDVFNDKDANFNQQPVHEVCVDGFYMGKFEVTQGEWSEIMESNPSRFFGERQPVEEVSWNDAQAFIAKLNVKSGKQYRLPTEAEWEYAARSGGKKEEWPGSSNVKSLGDYAWYYENSGKTTHPVGQKKPNGLGIHDMFGNVDEWCSDFYNSRSYDSDYVKKQAINPQGPSQGEYAYNYGRVVRGGAWSSHPIRKGFSRENTFYRTSYKPDFHGYSDGSSSIGFRLVLSPETTAESTHTTGYKSPEQIMEHAIKLENAKRYADANTWAINMYKVIIEQYPDSRQAKMAKSRIEALGGRIKEEQEAAKQREQEEENRRFNERYNANRGHNSMCRSNRENCMAGCESISRADSRYYSCKDRCDSGYNSCTR
jgi:sulfatase modifying factor 1